MGIVIRSVKNVVNAVRGIPAVVLANLLLTRRCTQRCLQCSIPENPGPEPFMPMDRYRYLVDMFNRHGSQFISLSGGEPILHPQIDECIRYASEKRFVHVQLLSTMYAGEQLVDKVVETLMETGAGVQVSFDGFGEVADKIRGARNVSDTVQRSMELLTRENKKRRKPVRTSANIVMSRLNLHQVPEILRYIESLGWRCNVDLYRWLSDSTDEVPEMKLEDSKEFRRVLDIIRNSPAVTTPRIIIDRFPDFLAGTVPKRCPYLEARGFGTKIYVNPDATVNVCLGKPIGNLEKQTLPELFASDEWYRRIDEMKRCSGCWNSCYTPSSITFHPTGKDDLKAIWDIVRKG